ncbi:TapY2 family type IVa secretion system protein [Shewanella cyperi]|uniref:TapY2 family type IVa secretion system protein n=1 Tax=Shewanella cyperi TaxID=2814292 RepID=UPI001A94C93C|nr:TapY2 family type IVa secretion system protein [Shewanella cyperi]QSX41651.1 TapY2 family type IVa secretion system protein [Shewanella cyperi]
MNKLLMLSLLSLVFSSEAGAVSYQDFKCYLTASQGQKILFFSWEINSLQENQQKLVGKKLADVKGKANFVKEVHECVPMGKSFSSLQARRLDKKTLK